MTPPATPNGSQEDLLAAVSPAPPVFHNFLRAFFQFQPTYTMSDSTVTLPLSEGDVVLVHSIHTNGWADGTLLVSGARGWLPTNYCEAYDPDEMRNLLKALLNFWDLLRSTAVNDSEIFGNQEFMKGIIAGVRYLLVCALPAPALSWPLFFRHISRICYQATRPQSCVSLILIHMPPETGEDTLPDKGVGPHPTPRGPAPQP